MTFAEFDEICKSLHVCRYCDNYTGSDDTGCSGRPAPCKWWHLDRITMPRWAAEYADLVDPGDD